MHVVRVNVWMLFLLLVWLLMMVLRVRVSLLLLVLLVRVLLLVLLVRILLLLMLLIRILLLLVLLVMLVRILLRLLEGVWFSRIIWPLLVIIVLGWLLFLVHFLLIAFGFLLTILGSLGRRFLLREFDRLREVDDVLVFDRHGLLRDRLCNFFGFLLSEHDNLHTVVDPVCSERSL